MVKHLLPYLPSALAGGLASGLAVMGVWPAAVIGMLAAGAGVGAALLWPPRNHLGTRTVSLAADPRLLAKKRLTIAEELGVLEAAQDLQRSVFEVSAELVGCVDEADALLRFSAAMRRYWAYSHAELLVWERGKWRTLGGGASTTVLSLDGPVALPEETGGDLVLDLSPGVDGQAAMVLHGAGIQPSLKGRSPADQRHVADVLRGQLALSLRRVILYGELQSLARLDPLTSAHRRWYGETRLRELVDAGEVVAVAMVDIDFFKRINDEHGHAAGDLVLAAVGRELGTHLRTGDLVCRFGGEEFLVILPDTPPAGAMQVAERLRAAIADLKNLPHAVTVSIGVAACHQDETPESLIKRADTGLYAAKDGGRNCVILTEDKADGFLRTTARRSKRVAGSDSSLHPTVTAPAPAQGTQPLA